MKLKSLILGSVAAAGLSTAGFAADLGVLTSLDVCDSLGISGLTLSSTDHCLAITGNVAYEFQWGDYDDTAFDIDTNAADGDDDVEIPDDDDLNDWRSKVEAWIQFVGSSSTDFGRAAATIKLKSVSDWETDDGDVVIGGDATDGDADGGNGIWILDEAFVQVGDTTTIMAGKKGSIANFGNDEPLNFLGLFNSQSVDTGVMYSKNQVRTGGHVIQVVSQVADGFTVKAGLENLDGRGTPGYNGFEELDGYEAAGTLVGVVEYAGNGIAAHVTGLAGGILDGEVESWATHAGVSATFDMFSVVLAGAYGTDDNDADYWNVLGSAKAGFDIFEIAISGEANGGEFVDDQIGFGGSVGASVFEGVKINLGARWFDEDTDTDDNEAYQVAAQVAAAVTETISVTGEIGYFDVADEEEGEDFYGSALLEWKPGGGFTSSLKGEAHQTGAYKVTFKAAKEFK